MGAGKKKKRQRQRASLPPHLARQLEQSAQARPAPASTCRGHCKRDGVSAPAPLPGDRGYWAKDGGRLYCRQCRTYMRRRPECPCDAHHSLRGGNQGQRQSDARDLFEREAAARSRGPGGHKVEGEYRHKAPRSGRMAVLKNAGTGIR